MEEYEPNRFVICNALVKYGFQVHCTPSIETAWEIYATTLKGKVDAFIVELSCQCKAGVKFIERIRQKEHIEGLAKSFILGLSGNCGTEIEEIKKEGRQVDEYIGKPMKMQMLIESLKKGLNLEYRETRGKSDVVVIIDDVPNKLINVVAEEFGFQAVVFTSIKEVFHSLLIP